MKLLLFFCLLTSAAALTVADVKLIELPTCEENLLNDIVQKVVDMINELAANIIIIKLKLIKCYVVDAGVDLGANTTTAMPSTEGPAPTSAPTMPSTDGPDPTTDATMPATDATMPATDGPNPAIPSPPAPPTAPF